MAEPYTFGDQVGPIPLSALDSDFSAVGALGIVPCAATGTNSITLTPFANTPTISAYVNYLRFGFVAVANATGAVTVQVNAIGLVPLYTSDAMTQAGNGSVSLGIYYDIVYTSALNGFQIVSAIPINQLLNSISATQGAILFRAGSSWSSLQAGVPGQLFQTNGPAANPSYVTSSAAAVLRQATLKSSAIFTTGSTTSVSTVYKLIMTGGGGGAGTYANAEGGGGAAATVIMYFSGQSAGTPITLAIGSGGTGATSGATAGTNGSSSAASINSVLITAGFGFGSLASSFTGGSGGLASNAVLNIQGGDGSTAGGALGGGTGGASYWGGGGAGGSTGTGRNGVTPGSGGGGAAGSANGGNGADGIGLLEWAQ